MPFQELDVTLIVNKKPWDTMSFNVDLDVDSGEPIDIYKKFTWQQGENPAFIHVSEVKRAWSYLKKHGISSADELE